MTNAQNPAMQEFGGCPGSGGQQSESIVQRSSVFAHSFFGGEHVPGACPNSVGAGK
jgi:hypothetical protein